MKIEKLSFTLIPCLEDGHAGSKHLGEWNFHPNTLIIISLWFFNRAWHIRGGTQKFSELLKNIFKIFVQVWNFSTLRSTPSATGCSNPSTAPNAGNIVQNLQRKCCQRPPTNRWRPLTAFPLGAVLGLLHPVAGGVLRRGLKFQTRTNI